jgi:hypothetical protein
LSATHATHESQCDLKQPAGRCDPLCVAVQVYERRPEPKLDAVDTGRAYIIIVIPRGQAALKEVRDAWGGNTTPTAAATGAHSQ